VEAIGREPGTRCLLVAHRGELVVERTFAGGGPDEPVNVKSASKSLLSALIGIAMERGELSGVETPVAELLPGAFSGAGADGKRRIELRHLLTMTAGLESTSGAQYGAWVASPDWVAAALARPLIAAPGAEFIYSTGNSHVLGVILARATGRSLREYAQEHLLGPLGMRVTAWDRDPDGHYLGGNNVSLSPRDLLRFGLLYAHGGRQGERQIVPAAWVAESTRPHSEGWPDRYGAYGYLWWVRPQEGAFVAVGYGGQFVYVAPEEQVVIVLVSSLDGKGEEWDRRVLPRLHAIVEELGSGE
jgi:CubicO group peptidase (beta-lactamase class C family)